MKRISVSIITHNSDDLIVQCLESLEWADEIIVVDGESTDNTVNICKQFSKVKVLVVPNNPNLDVNKNIAIDNCASEWILVLDSDEVVTPELGEELRRIAREDTGGNSDAGYWIPRRNLFLGKWMRASGWYPDHVLRYFRKGMGKFPCKHVHERLDLNGNAGYLTGDLLHYTYRSFAEYFEKMDRYTSFEAAYMSRLAHEHERFRLRGLLRGGPQRRSYLRSLWWKYIPFKPVFRILLVYFARRGFLDGRHGFMLAVLSGVSDFVSMQKYRATREKGDDS